MIRALPPIRVGGGGHWGHWGVWGRLGWWARWTSDQLWSKHKEFGARIPGWFHSHFFLEFRKARSFGNRSRSKKEMHWTKVDLRSKEMFPLKNFCSHLRLGRKNPPKKPSSKTPYPFYLFFWGKVSGGRLPRNPTNPSGNFQQHFHRSVGFFSGEGLRLHCLRSFPWPRRLCSEEWIATRPGITPFWGGRVGFFGDPLGVEVSVFFVDSAAFFKSKTPKKGDPDKKTEKSHWFL